MCLLQVKPVTMGQSLPNQWRRALVPVCNVGCLKALLYDYLSVRVQQRFEFATAGARAGRAPARRTQEQGTGRYKNSLFGNWFPNIHVKETQVTALASNGRKDNKEKYYYKCRIKSQFILALSLSLSLFCTQKKN